MEQEKILTNILNNMRMSMQYSDYEIISTIRDCFAITRLKTEIGSLSKLAGFNEEPRKQMAKKYDELEEILLKYKNILDGQTGT